MDTVESLEPGAEPRTGPRSTQAAEFTLGGPRHDWWVRFDPTSGVFTLADQEGVLARLPDAARAVNDLVADVPVSAIYLPTVSDLSVGWTITRFSLHEEYLLHNAFGEPAGALSRGAAATALLREAVARSTR